MRKKFVAGNWKMFTTAATAQTLAKDVVLGAGDFAERVTIAVCPPFPYLERVAQTLSGSRVALGGQNLYPEKEGAFTGEVSPTMLLDVGCEYVILGHSERRHKLGETDALVNRKVLVALATELKVILCVGETLEERQSNRTEAVLVTQLTGSLAQVRAEDMPRLVLAYEPVWAIGTGQNATPAQAQEVHAFLRRQIAGKYDQATADALTIQYGGSVNPGNAASLLGQADVDGALVGGASLKADQFLAIVKAAIS